MRKRQSIFITRRNRYLALIRRPIGENARPPLRCIQSRFRSSQCVLTLILFAPLFLIFEVWQLVLSERYLGIKQIARGTDPRNLGLGELTAFIWSMMLLTYWLWMVVLLALPLTRVHGLSLL